MIRLKRMIRRSWRYRALVYYLAFVMAVITGIPGRGQAGVVPTEKSLEVASTGQFDREADMALVLQAFGTENGRRAMVQVGVTFEEMETYLGRMNDAQINLLAGKLRSEIPAGGGAEGVFWALITILLILFIVFLVLDVTETYRLPFRRK